MRVLVIGAGSMGQRRLRSLRALGIEEITLFEPQEGRCQNVADRFGIEGLTDFKAAFERGPQILVVSTPPAFHDPYVREAIIQKMHVFVEVPFALDMGLVEEIATQPADYPGILGVSHTIRYYPPFRIIHDLIETDQIGRPLYLEYSLGNYLPDWHPYEDYRKFYAADAQLGGAGMDMLLHELAAIQWWLGPVESVYARFSKMCRLEIKGPDSHDILLSFKEGARGFFHHDVIEQGSLGRHARIVGENGTIEWHQNSREIRFFHSEKGQAELIPFSRAADWEEAIKASREIGSASRDGESGRIPEGASEDFYNYESNYLRETRHFLDAVRGRSLFNMSSIAEELQNLRTFQALTQSAREQREVSVKGQK